MNDHETHLILFDGVCSLCSRMVQFITRQDVNGKFRFASLQSDDGQTLLKKYGLPTTDFDTVVFISEDRCLVKSSAVLHVFRVLGGFWKLIYILIIFPRPLRDFVYDIIAKTR
ncbi:MAG: DCC1-like thiol-disulfide oxidoreductase family protein [Bacteroidales bacterium]|nr:DCC1-like thiol-disulfide oxidoreductase family protein [Bacteroidales bacterium]